MDIRDFLVADDVLIGLRASDKTRLLQELSARAAASLRLDPDQLCEALFAREALGSTGVGGGVAIPHARVAGVKKPFGILACTKRPVAFEAIDNQPVDIVFLLLLPADPDPEHLHALASVARALRDLDLVQRLRRARDSSAAYSCLVGSGG
jgi:PTS system nitrogen regulatory IIA component